MLGTSNIVEVVTGRRKNIITMNAAALLNDILVYIYFFFIAVPQDVNLGLLCLTVTFNDVINGIIIIIII